MRIRAIALSLVYLAVLACAPLAQPTQTLSITVHVYVVSPTMPHHKTEMDVELAELRGGGLTASRLVETNGYVTFVGLQRGEYTLRVRDRGSMFHSNERKIELWRNEHWFTVAMDSEAPGEPWGEELPLSDTGEFNVTGQVEGGVPTGVVAWARLVGTLSGRVFDSRIDSSGAFSFRVPYDRVFFLSIMREMDTCAFKVLRGGDITSLVSTPIPPPKPPPLVMPSLSSCPLE